MGYKQDESLQVVDAQTTEGVVALARAVLDVLSVRECVLRGDLSHVVAGRVHSGDRSCPVSDLIDIDPRLRRFVGRAARAGWSGARAVSG